MISFIYNPYAERRIQWEKSTAHAEECRKKNNEPKEENVLKTGWKNDGRGHREPCSKGTQQVPLQGVFLKDSTTAGREL